MEGHVSIDGEPIAQGLLTFMPKGGPGQPVGGAIEDGRYRVEGVPYGTVVVTFNAIKETGRTVQEYGREVPQLVDAIPRRYASGIAIDVAPGQETRDFELSTD